MAWAEQMPSKRWRGGYRDMSQRKKYVTNEGRGYERKKDAEWAAQEEEVKARRLAAADGGRLPGSITWGALWDLSAAKRRQDTDTFDSERSIVEKHLRPRWGEVPLNKIQRKAVQSYINTDLVPYYSPAYVARVYSVFSSSINTAVDEEVLTASPCVRIKLPKIPKLPRPYMDEDYVPSMGKYLQEVFRDMTEFQLETGLRPGELCGLHADQIDRKRRSLAASKVFVTKRKIIRLFPKNTKSREVPLTSKAMEILDRTLMGRDLKRGCGLPHSDGKPCRSDVVFRSVQDKPVSPENLRKRLTWAAEKAGVEYRSPYAGRRGFATRVTDNGLQVQDLQSLLGHASADQSLDYVQQSAAAHARVRAALGDHPPLELIKGHGAGQGAEVSDQAPSSTSISGDENTG